MSRGKGKISLLEERGFFSFFFIQLFLWVKARQASGRNCEKGRNGKDIRSTAPLFPHDFIRLNCSEKEIEGAKIF